jgi:hypothetical protein
LPAVRKAKDFIRGAVGVGFNEYKKKDADLGTVAVFYNTPYQHKVYGSGLFGLWDEAVATLDNIAKRLRRLKGGLFKAGDGSCSEKNLYEYLQNNFQFDAKVFPVNDDVKLSKLKISYCLSYIIKHSSGALKSKRAKGVYERYNKVWKDLQSLSVLELHGRVRQKGRLGEACMQCSGAEISLSPHRGFELPGCEVRKANAKGEFVAYVFTRTSGLSIQLSAKVGDRLSDVLTIDQRSTALTPFPFVFKSDWFTIPIDLEDEQGQQSSLGLGEKTPTPEPTDSPAALVPDVKGKSVSEARAAIAAAGLKMAAPQGGDPAPRKYLSFKVASQSPLPDSAVPLGSVVKIVVYGEYKPAGYEVPDVIGMSLSEARQAIEAAELSAKVKMGRPPAPKADLVDTVMSQTPLGGTILSFTETVTLAVYGPQLTDEDSPEDQPEENFSPSPTASPTPKATPRPTATPKKLQTDSGGWKPDRIIDGDVPRGPNYDLAGTWDTTGGVVFKARKVSGNSYVGIIKKIYRSRTGYHARIGDKFLTATKIGDNVYKAKVFVYFKNGMVKTVGGPPVVVNGNTAQAGRLKWRRLKEN